MNRCLAQYQRALKFDEGVKGPIMNFDSADLKGARIILVAEYSGITPVCLLNALSSPA